MPLRRQTYMVLQYIKDHPEDPYLTQSKVAKALDITEATISKIIAVLLAENKVKVITVGNSNFLVAKEEENDGNE